VRNDLQRAARLTFGCIQVGRFFTHVAVGQTHHQLRFAPRGIKAVIRRFEFRTNLQSSLIVLDYLVDATPAVDRRVKRMGPITQINLGLSGASALASLRSGEICSRSSCTRLASCRWI